MSGSTGTLGFTGFPRGFPQVLMMSRVVAFFRFSFRIVDRFVDRIMVRFAALLGSVGAHAKQVLI